MINFLRHTSFGLDLGNNNTLVADRERVLLTQPSCIVFNSVNHSVKAVGDAAYEMMEKTHDELTAIKPLRCGVIADFESASTMIREMVNRAYTRRPFLSGFDRIISGVPYYTTEVERRALRAALDQFDPKRRSLLFEPLAACIGMDLNIQEPEGKMVIDIGGGITEIAIISLSGIAAFQSLKVAGDTFDMNIQDYFRRNYNMAIGLKTAELIKIKLGAVLKDLPDSPGIAMVKGKDMVTGIPVTIKIDHAEVCSILERSISAIEQGIIQALETCPPELASDIYKNGMHLTGGGSMLRGIKERFERNFQLPVHLDNHPLSSVSIGIAKALASPEKYQSVLID